MFRIVATLALALSLQAADKPIPPPGVAVPPNDRKDIESGLARLSESIDKLKDNHLAPDVIIYRDAVLFALKYNEFFKVEDIGRSKELLRQGQERAEMLLRGEAPWTTATGLVVRGYRSRIDESVQPYGLVIPASWSPQAPRHWRLDAWFRGRSDSTAEINFLVDRQTRPGEFTPPDTIVLHLYGRFCNANKFAGEVDFFEALAAVKRHYRIDDNRIAVRGFSMGGAAVWQFATHFAGLWAVAAPGAGFAESAEFLKVWQRETIKPTWWEQKLWRMYDSTEYALNFYNLPLVAYSGEIDGQKQAADLMAKYLEKEGMKMTHIIGPNTPHRYHPDSKVEINRRIDAIMEHGRDPYPRTVKFVTYTLAYNRMKWVQVDALGEHWERATVIANVANDHTVKVETKNVTAMTLNFGSGACPLSADSKPTVNIDGQTVNAPGLETDRGWVVHLRKSGNQWAVAEGAVSGLQKRHRLQGPIDDAFMNRFIFVLPTGEPMHRGSAERIAAEQARAIVEWRKQFRGEPLVKKDTEITEADIANSNLVMWGDPSSNKLLARIADKLPAKWTSDAVAVGSKKFSADKHYPALIYPNPLNANKYVVVNSSFTYREYDYLNNARQVSKLPDWAIVDVTTPADGRFPGKIAEAGFFNERWEVK